MDQTLGSSSDDRLPRPVPGGRALTTAEREQVDLAATIKGWGSDLDTKLRPGVPRDKAPDIGVELLYPPIPSQPQRFRIHKSTEHGRLPPVFGTSCPPSGLSGRLRDLGYRFSEGRLSRWMTLMLADRINVVEDLMADLARGRLPNIPREMGMKSEWKHNRAAFIRKTAVVAACSALAIAYWRARRRR